MIDICRKVILICVAMCVLWPARGVAVTDPVTDVNSHDSAIVNVRITQVSASLPALTAWVDIRDLAGKPVTGIGADRFVATVNGLAVPVDTVRSLEDAHPGTAFVLLIDKSGTMRGEPMAAAKRSALALIAKLRDNDKMAVVSFGDGVSVEANFSSSTDRLKTALAGIRAGDNSTHLYEAIRRSEELLSARSDDSFPRRHAILLMSDGKDEGSGFVLEDLLDADHRISVPILATGYSRIGTGYFAKLRRLAVLSSGQFLAVANAQQIEQTFAKLVAEFGEGYELVLSCTQCPKQGGNGLLQISVSDGSAKFAASRRLDLPPWIAPTPVSAASRNRTTDQPRDWWRVRQNQYMILVACAGLLCLLLLGRKSKKPVQDPSAEIPARGIVGEQAVVVQKPAPVALAHVKLSWVSGIGKLDTQARHAVTAAGLIIGREGEVRISGDEEISRHHAKLSWSNNEVLVQDLNSMNGTYRNGEEVVGRQLLVSGDQLKVGETVLRIDLVGKA